MKEISDFVVNLYSLTEIKIIALLGQCKQKGWMLQAAVNACTTTAELEAIVWT